MVYHLAFSVDYDLKVREWTKPGGLTPFFVTSSVPVKANLLRHNVRRKVTSIRCAVIANDEIWWVMGKGLE
ncbi:hypothetical protein PM082_001978 [Marasmius tenuissimus]|nr:hypothetical protein PM082_001978 [Marasmius tenuissimus]